MSYEIVKSIAVKDDKVYLTSADSSLRPLHFSRWESTVFSKILAEKGKDALYAKIGEDVWNGNLQLRQGNRLCRLYLKACDAFPSDMNFMTFDAKTAGELLGKMVTSLEKDPAADLSEYVDQARALQSDREYILEAAHRTGYNFLNYASADVQSDSAFALEVLRAGHGAAWFDYPKAFTGEREVAIEALKLNGCFYRQLDESLKADREIILNAFAETEGRTFHEHLPDLIPPWVFTAKEYLMDVLERANALETGQKIQFIFDNWSWTLKKEEKLYEPFSYSLQGSRTDEKGELTGETWSRRYTSAEKAVLHICNKLNENANIKNLNSFEDVFKSKNVLDRGFVCRLIENCPSLHMQRSAWLLGDRDVALKWVQVGKFFPYCIGDLPKQYLTDQEFQDTLCKRFEGTDRFDILAERFEMLGVPLNKKSLGSQIQAAENKALEQTKHSAEMTHEHIPGEKTR